MCLNNLPSWASPSPASQDSQGSATILIGSKNRTEEKPKGNNPILCSLKMLHERWPGKQGLEIPNQ